MESNLDTNTKVLQMYAPIIPKKLIWTDWGQSTNKEFSRMCNKEDIYTESNHERKANDIEEIEEYVESIVRFDFIEIIDLLKSILRFILMLEVMKRISQMHMG